MNLNRAIVIDETELAEAVHEITHTRARRADHFSTWSKRLQSQCV
jgi:hypothetical protein